MSLFLSFSDDTLVVGRYSLYNVGHGFTESEIAQTRTHTHSKIIANCFDYYRVKNTFTWVWIPTSLIQAKVQILLGN